MVQVCMGWDAEGRGGGGVNDLPHIYTDKDYAMHKYNHMVVARPALSDIIICTGIPTSITLSCDLYCRSQPNRQFSPKLFLKQPCRLPSKFNVGPAPTGPRPPGWKGLILYGDCGGVSSHSLALWSLLRQVAQMCLKAHEPGYAYRPLFQEAHMHSRVSGLGALLWGFCPARSGMVGGSAPLPWPRRTRNGCPGGCRNARAQSCAAWSASWQRVQKAPCPLRVLNTVAASRLAFGSFHTMVGSHAACCLNTRSYSNHPTPP